MSEDESSDTFAAGSAPGDSRTEPHELMREVYTYLIGLGLAALLTVASFWVAGNPDVLYGPGVLMALAALAIAQMGVHLTFFLHITTGPDNINNVLALAFGVLIVGLVISGSLWIMYHMDMNMMAEHASMAPMGESGAPMQH